MIKIRGCPVDEAPTRIVEKFIGGGGLARTYPIDVHVSRDTCTVHVECKAERAHKSQLHVDTHSGM